MARRRLRWILPAVFGVLGVAAFTGAAIAGSRRETAGAGAKPRRPRGISLAVYALADKWAKARKLPLQWVLSTILVESGGVPTKEGDCFRVVDGRKVRRDQCMSLGLMQVNWRAHGARLQQLGIARTRTDLFNPDINIEAGTLILREVWDAIYRELGGRQPPAPLDVLIRFGYKGLSKLRQALREGIHPQTRYKDGDVVVSRWSRALAQTTAVV